MRLFRFCIQYSLTLTQHKINILMSIYNKNIDNNNNKRRLASRPNLFFIFPESYFTYPITNKSHKIHYGKDCTRHV